MKKVVLCICLICLGIIGFTQQPNPLLIQSDAKLLGTRANGYASIQTYNQGTKGFQFFPVTWSAGELQTTDNLLYNSGYLFSIDKIHQQLFIIETATSKIMNIDKNQIKKFRINTDNKDHNFKIADTYLNSHEKNFCEILVDNPSKYSLIKIITTKFIRADNADFAKMKEGEFSDEFIDNASYYVIKPSLAAKKITFKENSIEKAFLEKNIAADYLTKNEFAKKDEYFLINIVNNVNENLK